jgi:hypothetical protein
MHGLPSLEQFIQRLAGPLDSVSISYFLLRFAPVGPPAYTFNFPLAYALERGCCVICG